MIYVLYKIDHWWNIELHNTYSNKDITLTAAFIAVQKSEYVYYVNVWPQVHFQHCNETKMHGQYFEALVELNHILK